MNCVLPAEGAKENQKAKVKMQNCGTAARNRFYQTAGGNSKTQDKRRQRAEDREQTKKEGGKCWQL